MKAKGQHGGRRPGAGAPRGNLNAFKHGFCSVQYEQRLQEAARSRGQQVLAHLRDLVRAYHQGRLSRARKADLVRRAGLVVLTAWYDLSQELLAEQSRR